ncbi:Uncharacterised protein [uncultured archaeon]|nr:Uncharacterised protein [uncultured archaeon]
MVSGTGSGSGGRDGVVLWLEYLIVAAHNRNPMQPCIHKPSSTTFKSIIYKSHMKGHIISARDMTIKERKYYNDKKI